MSTLALVAGVPTTDFQAAPTQPLLRAFGDRVVTLEGNRARIDLTNTWTAVQPLPGVTDGSNALPGNVGYHTEQVRTTTAVPGSNQWFDATTSPISLAPGDWDVSLIAHCDANGGTITAWAIGIGTTSGNSSAGLTIGQNRADFSSSVGVIQSHTLTVPTYRISLSTTTSYYAKAICVVSSGSPQIAGCRISARRVR